MITHGAGADDYSFCLAIPNGNPTLGGGQSTTFGVGLGGTPLGVVGFSVEFDYAESVPDLSLASDLRVIITAPDGTVFSVGGFDNAGSSNALWSFQGPGSGGAGHYGSNPQDIFLDWKDDPQPNAVWLGTFVNDRGNDPNPNTYNNLKVTFYTAPEWCDADMSPPSGDGVVDINDLLVVINFWGAAGCLGCIPDIVPACGDNQVNVNDLLGVINSWGPCAK
jgi:hypothetical protein